MAAGDPTALGKYTIVRPLGRGAMGVVYEGFDPVIDRRVAIKTVRLDRVDEAEGAEDLLRFKREAQAAGRLTHPNIVGVYDYGETDELAFIVMEFVEGDTLKSLLDRGERFTPAAAVGMLESLLAGLAYSHEHGVIHRDIKPANVMITRDGRVKLADFGVARIESSSLTQAGTMIGTPSYMSPEQFMGQTIDARSDIYAAGVLLYQLLTGDKPFEGSVTSIMHKVLNTEAPPPSALSVAVDPALDAVVARAMAKRPEARFATARDFATALRATEAPVEDDATMIRPLAARPDPAAATRMATGMAAEVATTPRGGRGPLIAGGVAAILVVAGVAGFMVLGGHATHPVAASHPAKATATPQPASVPAPAQAPAPAPAPAAKAAAVPAPPSPAQLRARAIAVAASASCALIHGTIGADGGDLAGLVRADQHGRFGRALAMAVDGGAGAPPVHVALRDFTGPYCGMIAAIKPYAPVFAAPGERLALHLAGHATRLVKGQHLVVELGLPVWARYAEVDYVSSSGATYRLYPTTPTPPALTGSTLVLGKPPGPAWAVGKPYGTDMIVAIASSAPIDTMPAAQSATVATLAPAATTALTELQANGAKLATAAILVDTVRSP